MMRCDNCIHKDVCKIKPPEQYPEVMKQLICCNCEHFKECETQ